MPITSYDVITHSDVDFDPGEKSTHVIYFKLQKENGNHEEFVLIGRGSRDEFGSAS